jgi:hypothetical protein
MMARDPHAYDVLNRPADARARYSLGATVGRTSRSPRSRRSQPESQMGRDAAVRRRGLRRAAWQSIFFCSDPAPEGTMISACIESTACLASLKTSCGLFRTTPSPMLTFTVRLVRHWPRSHVRETLHSGRVTNHGASRKEHVGSGCHRNIWRVNSGLSPSFLLSTQSLIAVRSVR